MNFVCLYNRNVEKCINKKTFSNTVIFRFVQNSPLDCKLTKSVKTISKPNQSKTTKKTIKNRIKAINTKRS